MTKRRSLITSVILFSGIALSLGLFVVANQASYLLQRLYFQRDANQRVEELTQHIAKQLYALQEFGRALAACEDGPNSQFHQVPEDEFRRLAATVCSMDGIESVEWCPLVPTKSREQFERDMEKALGAEFQIAALDMKSGERRLTAKIPFRTLFPIRFVEPESMQDSVIGGLRNTTIPRLAAGHASSMLIGTARVFYPGKLKRHGAYFTVGKNDGNGRREPLGVVTAMLQDKLFPDLGPIESDMRPVLVRVTDVTNYPKSVTSIGSDLPVVGTGGGVSVPGDDGSGHFARIVPLGGRDFHFDCYPNPNNLWRPTWLPGAALFLGLVLTAICTSYWTNRDTRETALLNAQREIEERKGMQQFLQSMLEFREQERELVAHEIHDGFVQQVVGAQMFVQAVSSRLNEQDPACQRDLSMANNLLSKAIDEGRRMISDLKPSVVDELGLIEAVEQLVREEEEQYGLSVTFRRSAEFRRLPQLVERTLYRVIQESLTNVKRHSGVDEAALSLFQNERSVVLEVKDRGRGFDQSQVEDGRFGIRGIQERARLLQGHATISSVPQEGTLVTVQIPISGDVITGSPHFQARLAPALSANVSTRGSLPAPAGKAPK